MPFKTKREKIAAATHRFTFVQTKAIDYPAKEVINKEKVKTVGFENQPQISVAKIEANYSYVKGDLTKIMLLTATIIIAQVSLFLLRQFLPNIAFL